MRQALDDLGITDADAAEIGLRVYKVAMPWPLEPEGVRQFAEGLEEILVVEEKRQVVEYQLKEQLYNWRDDVRPRVVGKFDEKGEWVRPHGDWLLPAEGELTPAMIARVIARRIERLNLTARTMEKLRARVDWINAKEAALAKPKISLVRQPYFCSGCPHNTSTRLPEGSRATAGIGCHVMAIWMDRNTSEFTHMGAEGVPWIGQAPFTDEKHIFANLGDGTYYHSGILAIRAAVAANVNITYKILYNDAVAMTGGQPIDGPLTPADIARQVAAEGREAGHRRHRRAGQVSRAATSAATSASTTATNSTPCSANCARFPASPSCSTTRPAPPRSAAGASAASTPIRRRRVVINELVCEGCGDCGVAVELRVGRAAGNRVRPQAHDRPVVVQQGLFLRQGLLPELRHRRGRHAAQAAEGRGRRLPHPARPALPGRRRSPTASWSPASAAPASSPSARCSAWPRTSRARAAACST